MLIRVPLEYLHEESPSELVDNVLQQIKNANNLLADPEGISRILVSPGCLSLADHELFVFLKETVNCFSDCANEKCITLRWVDEPAFVTMCLDREKMTAILQNLLMAFTDSINRDGEILPSISCNTQDWELRLESEDNGLLKKKF